VSNLSERQLLITTIAVAVLITGGLLYFVFSDRDEIEGIEEEISALDTRLQAAEIERRKIPAREDKVLQFRAVEPRELAVLPTEQRISDFHRNISSFLSAAGIGFQELPESSPEDSELAKGIRVTRNKLKGRGVAASILKFLNMIENDPRLVAIKGFKVQAGDVDRDAPEADVLHDFELELETYFYRPNKGGIRREHIPGAEERLQDPKMRAAIAAFQPERPDTYVLRPAVGRRDPLVDPRRKAVTVDPAELEEQFQREEAVVVELENRYREVAELLEKEKALERVGDLFRLDRIRREIDAKINDLRARMEHVAVTKSVQIAELAARIDIILENINRMRSSRAPREVIVTRAVAEKVLEELSGLFEAGNYQEIDDLGRNWVGFLRSKEVMEEAKPVLERIKALREKGKVLGEFSTMHFEITGVIVDHENAQRSIANVNGKSLRVGDAVDSKTLVKIEAITRHSVSFRYKDEVIKRGVGRAKASGKPGKGARKRPTSKRPRR
jgi:Tfp pilus assembly protein PilO